MQTLNRLIQVQLTLLDEHSNELARSSRPVMLPHTSELLKRVNMLFYWPLFLLGFKTETETLVVPCINFFEVRRNAPTRAVLAMASLEQSAAKLSQIVDQCPYPPTLYALVRTFMH